MAISTEAHAPADELHDPDCLSDRDVDRLLGGAPWRRFAILGDSVAEGFREPTPGYDDSSWGERFARALARQQPELAYVNFGQRELRAHEVHETQLQPALDFAPDLAAVICGGNDLLVEHFDGAAVEQ